MAPMRSPMKSSKKLSVQKSARKVLRSPMKSSKKLSVQKSVKKEVLSEPDSKEKKVLKSASAPLSPSARAKLDKKLMKHRLQWEQQLSACLPPETTQTTLLLYLLKFSAVLKDDQYKRVGALLDAWSTWGDKALKLGCGWDLENSEWRHMPIEKLSRKDHESHFRLLSEYLFSLHPLPAYQKHALYAYVSERGPALPYEKVSYQEYSDRIAMTEKLCAWLLDWCYAWDETSDVDVSN